MRKLPRITHLLALQAITLACTLPISSHAAETRMGAGPAAWANDLTPIRAQDWSYDRAAHLLERAGFGGTPEEIRRLADMTPEQAVRHLVRYQDVDNSQLQPFRCMLQLRRRNRRCRLGNGRNLHRRIEIAGGRLGSNCGS